MFCVSRAPFRSRIVGGRRADSRSDDELVAAVRAGDLDAYGVLFGRHHLPATRYARRMVRPPADEDVVSAAYLAALEAIQRGHGPTTGGFRPYLLVAVRTAAAREAGGESRFRVSDDLSELAAVEAFADPVLTRFDASLITRAYAGLSLEHQTVLWHTAVEKEPLKVVAAVLGTTPQRVAGLAFRAREALAGRYLQLHLADAADEQCRYAVERMSGWVRGSLAERDREIVGRHLDDCERCRALAAELSDVNRSLRAAIWPLFFGAPTIAAAVSRRRGRGHRPVSPTAAVPALVAGALALVIGAAVAIALSGFSRASEAVPAAASVSSASTSSAAGGSTTSRATQATADRDGGVSDDGPGDGGVGAVARSAMPATPASRRRAPAAPVVSASNAARRSALTTPRRSAPSKPSPAPFNAKANCAHGKKVSHPQCA